MRCSLDLLADFTFNCWLLARLANRPGISFPEGRNWESAIGDLLRNTGLLNLQRAGKTTLFDTQAASGVAHELDGCAAGKGTVVIVECKSQKSGPTKADVALFHQKVMDFYCAKPEQFSKEHWWRILVSSSPVTDNVREFSTSIGLVLTEPEILPLPVVLWTASRPSADIHLREPLLQEAIRLGEQTLLAFQEMWAYDSKTGKICFKPSTMHSQEIKDLLWLQEHLGSDILNLYDSYRPELLERRSEELLRILRSNTSNQT